MSKEYQLCFSRYYEDIVYVSANNFNEAKSLAMAKFLSLTPRNLKYGNIYDKNNDCVVEFNKTKGMQWEDQDYDGVYKDK